MTEVSVMKYGNIVKTISVCGHTIFLTEEDANDGICTSIEIPNAQARDALIEALKGMVFPNGI